MVGESLQLGQIIVKKAEAGDVAAAEAAAHPAEDTAEGVAEDMEERPRRPGDGGRYKYLQGDQVFLRPGMGLSLVRTGATCMKRENAGKIQKRLVWKSMQLRLPLSSQTDPLSPLKNRHLKIIMEELAVPLALVAVPIMAGDEEEDVGVLVIDLTLLDAGH